jgi:hypothetical protein
LTTPTKGRPAPDEVLLETRLSARSSGAPAQNPVAPTRYYFNLTNGDTMLRDEEGVEASSIQEAIVSALEAVEELCAQDASELAEWQGWRLEIVDASGRAVHSIPLDVRSAH